MALRLRLPLLPPRLARWLMLRTALLRHAVVVGVRVVVLDPDGRVFLVRHTYLSGWHLPGGGVEIGETVRTAAMREVREEAGLELRGDVSLVGVYLNGALANRNHVALFVARDFLRVADPAPDWEIAERGFFPPAELPAGTTPGTHRRLAEVLDGVPLSETW